MGEKTAVVRLDLKADGFKQTLGTTLKEIRKMSQDGASAFGKSFNAAAKGGLKAVKGVFSSLKSLGGQVAGLLGGIGFASLVKGSIESRKSFQQLAFTISLSSGKVVEWAALQKKVQQTALAAKVDIDKLGEGFKAALQETGDLKFAEESLEAIAIVGKKTGAEFTTLGKLAGVLEQKFGLANSEIGDGLLQMVSAANQGGASIEDLADDFAEVGGKAKTLGLQGPEGIRKMVGFLNLAKKETGNFSQAMTALPQVFDQIIERTSKGVVASGGKVPIKIEAVDKNGKPRDPFDIIQDILSKTKGDASKLGEFGFGGEGLQTLLSLAKPFANEIKTTGKLTAASGKKFQDNLLEAAGTTKKFSDVQGEAADASPAEKIQDAINRLKVAFTKPEMIAAIEKLAASLPKLADALATVLDKVLGSPIAAAGVFLGGKALLGGLGAGIGAGGGGGPAAAAMQAAMGAGGKTAAGSIGSAFRIGAGSLAGAMAPVAMIAGLTILAQAISDVVGGIEKDIADDKTNIDAVAKAQGLSNVERNRSTDERVLDVFKNPGAAAGRFFSTGNLLGSENVGRNVSTGQETSFGGAVSVDLAQDFDPNSRKNRRAAQDADIERASRASAEQSRIKRNTAFAERGLGRKLSGAESQTVTELSARTLGISDASPQDVLAQLKSEFPNIGKQVAAAIKTLPSTPLSVTVLNAEEIRGSSTTAPGSVPRP